jgi:hypothetical protein
LAGDEAGRGRHGDLRQDTDRTLRDVNDGLPERERIDTADRVLDAVLVIGDPRHQVDACGPASSRTLMALMSTVSLGSAETGVCR